MLGCNRCLDDRISDKKLETETFLIFETNFSNFLINIKFLFNAEIL